MKESYKTRVAVVLELVLDDTHKNGKRMKYVSTRDPETASQMIASVVDAILQRENEHAVFAKMNVVGVSSLFDDQP